MKKTSLFLVVVLAVIAILAGCASLSIESVDLASLKGSSKVRQYYSVSTAEVSVYATYKDGSRKEVVFFSTRHDTDSTGMQTVTVTISGQGTGTFQTEVMELTSIRVDSPPTKTTYTVGERADLSGIRVIGSWRDFPDAEISAYQVSVASFDSSSAGNKVVTVNYKGKTATFNVTVTAAAAPAAQQPSQPSAQQPAQPSAAWPPAENQPSPVGTWTVTGSAPNYIIVQAYTFNANGTGRYTYSVNGVLEDVYTDTFTWTASGNRLTITSDKSGLPFNYTYSISGNTLTWQQDGRTATDRWTRQ